MSDNPARAIRPADILSLLRESSDRGFVERNFRDPSIGSSFAARPATENAVVIHDPTKDVAPTTPKAPPPGIPEEEVEHRLAAARAAAKAEGIAEERARLTAQVEAEQAALREARDAFLRVVSRLSEVHPADSATLSAQLTEAVRRLASERAGLAIDDMPRDFLTRIESLAERVSQGVHDVRVRLNPGDFAAIQPHIDQSETIDPGNISIDMSLGRGDVIVRTEAVRLEDIIAPVARAKSDPSQTGKATG